MLTKPSHPLRAPVRFSTRPVARPSPVITLAFLAGAVVSLSGSAALLMSDVGLGAAEGMRPAAAARVALPAQGILSPQWADEVGVVIVAHALVYAGPSRDTAVLGAVERRAHVRVLAVRDEWYLVNLDGTGAVDTTVASDQGWIPAGTVTEPPQLPLVAPEGRRP